MTTYRDIPNSSIEAGAPISSPLMVALAENQEAIRTGVPDAPKIKAIALPDATSTASTKTNLIYASKVGKFSGDGESDVESEHFYVARNGQYAIHLVVTGDANSQGKIKFYKNGSLVATTAATNGSTFVVSTWRQDNLVAGDKISIKISDANTGTTWNRGDGLMFVYVNNPVGDIYIPPEHVIFGATRASTTVHTYGTLQDNY